jgi:hypothetical protein
MDDNTTRHDNTLVNRGGDGILSSDEFQATAAEVIIYMAPAKILAATRNEF